ncbi:succinate dehydrogenase iron-sulfur subunit [bacterium BMS3Bbin06]|nr:succinate dehydrogenase iron-sulfur subunit [bacterium BMS3Abin08]GBE34298.1 succinate dehydrogenase iron-sulfur subunit [bacterium BMS3Bbin06]HDO34746.1 succinate dehydrogenase iron-sulfur subunit [Nitrospirota bacterium]HDY71047.1 succinate dehydrogenase iron-sulfur subunit [Nitrospirota bacterium]
MSANLTVKVFRYNPEVDDLPRFDTFDVPEMKNMAVLDLLYQIQADQDRSLSFRCSCRIGMCGSCAMFINGKSRLACRTLVGGLGTKEIHLGPLPNLPILKDLVVDMDPFFDKYERVKPYFVPKEELKDFYRVPEGADERKLIDEMLECITCGACYSSCTMVTTDPDYLGPAALNRAFCLVADKRDGAGAERLRLVGNTDGIWRCHSQFNCVEVCPKQIIPTWSIQQLRKRCVFKKLGIRV